MTNDTALVAAMQIATEAVMRWFKTKDGTIYPDPQNAPEAERAAAAMEYRDCDSVLLDKARQSAHENHVKFQRLQTAVRSIVLRLRVLDIEQLAKEAGEDGTVPLRLSVAELRALDKAYDGKEDAMRRLQEYPGWDPGWDDQTTVATTTSMPVNYTYTTSSTSSSGYNYGGKKP